MGKGSGKGAATMTQRRTAEEEKVDGIQKVWREENGISCKVDRFYYPKGKEGVQGKTYTLEEIAKHNKRDDLWIMVEGKVYDISKYVEYHPGGWLPMVNMAGKDCTDVFANYHPAKVYRTQLPSYYIGEVKDYRVSEFVKEHRALRQQLLKEGLFETNPTYYIKLISWLSLLLLTSLYLTLACTSLPSHCLGACALALFWQQLAFVGHDVGHNAISHVRKRDLWWGTLLGNLTGGISLDWWKRSHNVHHVVCNSIENDPDIQHLPFFAVTPKIFGRFTSSYHMREISFDFFARMMVSYQHILFYPIMGLARINLYVQGWLLLLSKERVEHRKMELLSLTGFALWYGALLYSLPSNSERLLFHLISHGVAGILHVQITLSHFPMDTYHGNAYNDDSDEWFRMQVKTTMNVDCPWYMDWFHGGLQFQIEHHLWPRLPRHNLRYASKLTRALCKKHDIDYHCPGFIEGNVQMIRHLKKVALEARKSTKSDGGFYTSALWEGMNAQG